MIEAVIVAIGLALAFGWFARGWYVRRLNVELAPLEQGPTQEERTELGRRWVESISAAKRRES